MHWPESPKFMNFKARKLIFQSFVMSNFSYCPLVWHFCGKKNNSKIEKIQERALRIVCDDYTSTYQELLSKVGTTSVLQSRINCILLEVFKSINHTNPSYIQNMIDITRGPYNYRNSIKLIQPKKKSTNFGLRSFNYLAPKLWNDLLSKFQNIKDYDAEEFRVFLKQWDGPNYDSINEFYV